MINTKKTTQDILQEEMLRERVAVLARAGEQLTEALGELGKIEADIEARVAAWHGGEGRGETIAPQPMDTARQRLLCEINGKIEAYNRQRDHVRTRFYYLIVTREALGLIHHQRLEEIYRIPPKKRCFQES